MTHFFSGIFVGIGLFFQGLFGGNSTSQSIPVIPTDQIQVGQSTTASTTLTDRVNARIALYIGSSTVDNSNPAVVGRAVSMQGNFITVLGRQVPTDAYRFATSTYTIDATDAHVVLTSRISTTSLSTHTILFSKVSDILPGDRLTIVGPVNDESVVASFIIDTGATTTRQK